MDEVKLLGANLDPRTETEKQRDYTHEELSAAGVPTWEEKSQEYWRRFPRRVQGSAGTCVAQGSAKLLGVENVLEENKFVELSALDIYDRRANKPAPGMWGQDALNIISKFGATTEQRMPSQRLTEAQANLPVMRAKEDLKLEDKYRAGGYVSFNSINMDSIASVVREGKAVLAFFFFVWSEWNSDEPVIQKPTLKKEDDEALRHGVAIVDAFTIGGRKYFLIDDSAGNFFHFDGQRLISEDFFRSRCYFAGYVLDLSNNHTVQPERPVHTFTKKLSYGMMREPEVMALQAILQYEELFPQNVERTGNYYQVTAKAVLAWQRKHSVASEKELSSLGGRLCGAKTISMLNELYGKN